MNAPADFRFDDGILSFSGDLTLARIGDLPQRLTALPDPPSRIDLKDVNHIDTVGAWLIHRVVRDTDIPVDGASDDVGHLLEQVAAADKPLKIRPDARPSFLRVLDEMGTGTIEAGKSLYGLLGFFGATIIGFGDLIRHPGRFRGNAVTRQFEVVGVQALAIIGLMSFLIGIVIAQQGAVQLRQFGAEVFAINLIGRITIRELGVLMTAIMVAGRSGSAFAAQLGSMKLAEEIDAMRIIGVSPMEALILPRVMSAVILMPLLGFYAAVVAMIGGGIFCWIDLDIPPVTFIHPGGRSAHRSVGRADQGSRVRDDHRHLRLLSGHAGEG
jgi:phospholipid/cholesterol/gamma-HCH transport system permease protein